MHRIESFSPIFFLLLSIIMDMLLFLLAKWDSLMVDIYCPRGRS